MQIRDLITRGRPFTGRRLLQALELAAAPPVGGKDIRTRTVGDRTVIEGTRTRMIPRTHVFLAILAPTLIGPNRYEYAFVEQELTASNAWVIKPGGRTSADTGRRQARNFLELTNDLTQVLGGIDLDQTNPDVTLTMDAVRFGEIVQVVERRLPTSGDFAYWFSYPNVLHVECNAGGPIPALTPVFVPGFPVRKRP